MTKKKKTVQHSVRIVPQFFWPNFDYVRWNRAQETATLEEVIETSKTEEIGSVVLVSVEHVIKPKTPAANDKLKAKLSSVGI